MKLNIKHFRPLVFLALLPLFSACTALDAGKNLMKDASSYFLGGEDNTEPPAPLTVYEAEVDIEELWHEKTGDGTDEQFLKLIVSVNYGKVLTASHDGRIEARSPESGDVIWQTDTDYAFSAGPGSGSRTVVMGTSNAEVVAFDLESGEQLWASRVSSEVLAVPLVTGGRVIVRTVDGKVVALDERDGRQQWMFERNEPALSIRGTGSPIIVEGNIIAGYSNGKVVALRLEDGKNIWESTVLIPSGRSEIERLVDLDVDPVETGGVIYISSYQGGTTALLELDGDIIWRNEDVSSFAGISYDWRYLYVTDSSSDVWQLDQRNGAALWKQDELRFRKLTTPVAYDDYVVVGDLEGYLHWLSSSDGRQMGRVKMSGALIEAKPVAVDNVVYIYATDGSLAAYKVNRK